MSWHERLDQIGGIVLIYEGAGVAAKMAFPDRFNRLPLVSDVVWMVRERQFGWLLPTSLLFWMAHHFWTGGPKKLIIPS